MNTDVSTRRQLDLLTRLFALLRNRQKTVDALAQQCANECQHHKRLHSARLQETSRTLLQAHDALDAEFNLQLTSAREDCGLQLASINNELEEKLDTAARTHKNSLSDGEYDWFLSKKRLEKEYATDKQTTIDEHQQKRRQLNHYRAEYFTLSEATIAALARHRCDLVVQGGDLLEEPQDADYLAEHLKTFAQIQQLASQFRRVFWVRFVEERWFLIVFLLSIVTLAFPLKLVLSNIFVVATATGVSGILLTFAAWQLGRALASKSAHQFREPIANSIASGKQQLLAAREIARRRAELKLQRLRKQKKQRLADFDEQWVMSKSQVEARLAARRNELQNWSSMQTDLIEQKRLAAEESLRNHFTPQIARIQDELSQTREQLDAEVDKAVTTVLLEKDRQLETHLETSRSEVNEIVSAFQEMREVTDRGNLDFASPTSDWHPPAEPIDAVRFGNVSIRLSDLPIAGGEGFPVQKIDIPATLDLLHQPSLLVESDGPGRTQATEVLRLSMLRLLTSMPPGKLRFTIVDPIGLGQDFSAFMHLADHDEQLVGHRIWTEPTHINQRLTDLTKHMENVIQTYLRNEFASIHDYNQNAGEVAEPFLVLVIANFPAGFSDEAAQRLLSIANSGPRCGVYTLMSVDTNQTMPRNFDIDELRRVANVIAADGNEIRWAEPPLSGFPLQLDALPTEASTSALLHQIGRKAKDGNRVEVPFADVAPADHAWWSEDSRSEISVALGRAGATKLQEIRLGSGTSQHVLISGKTGSGKSTLLHAMITNLALKYSPAEVQFYLIDFKKGVEFKPYAEYELPHARVIAIESEREFGLSVLERLDGELRRRGDLFRRIGVQGLAGYRDARPDERMARTLLVIDEFQEFFVKEDKIAQEAALLLDRLVRQGRAFGIHVLLGSQTLAGAYSLARATIGQMAVRIALQCSPSDAHLILSDENDAARLLRRPGEAIYNDANGTVEGNHPFQVVWLSDVEKESYLRELKRRQQESGVVAEAPVIFEGNVAADVSRNGMLAKAWMSPAPKEVPLAPRAWVGEAVAIKEAPAVVFHRRSGSHLMLVGQQEEAALGVLASCLSSLAAFSTVGPAPNRSRFIVLDGTRPESNEAGYWSHFQQTTEIEMALVRPRDAAAKITELADEIERRRQGEDDASAANFLVIYNLSRFRTLQKSDDDFGLGSFGQERTVSAAEQLAKILRDGPEYGVHVLLWSDTHTNLMRWLDRQSLRDIESRVLFQMSATDSSNLMDSSAAAHLGLHRAILYSEDQGRAERFRPYGLPQDDWLLRVRSWHAERCHHGDRDNLYRERGHERD